MTQLCEPVATLATTDPRHLTVKYLPFAAALARRRAVHLGIDPDDLLGELLLLLVKRARHFDPDRGTWFAFVRLQLRAAAARLQRQRSRHGRVIAAETIDGEALVEHLPGPDGLPDEEAADRGEVEAALAAVEALSPRLRFVVRRHLGLGGTEPETFEEIGEAIGVSGARAAVLFGQAMRRMRRRLHTEPRRGLAHRHGRR